jgi:hypothetical protein
MAWMDGDLFGGELMLGVDGIVADTQTRRQMADTSPASRLGLVPASVVVGAGSCTVHRRQDWTVAR